MVVGVISLLGIIGGIALVLALGFGLMFLLWTLFQPPENPKDTEAK